MYRHPGHFRGIRTHLHGEEKEVKEVCRRVVLDQCKVQGKSTTEKRTIPHFRVEEGRHTKTEYDRSKRETMTNADTAQRSRFVFLPPLTKQSESLVCIEDLVSLTQDK